MIHNTFIRAPKLKRLINENSDKVKTFQNYKEIECYLDNLK